MLEKKTINNRLTISISKELHTRIKEAAIIKNISMKKYVLQNLLKVLIEDEKNRL